MSTGATRSQSVEVFDDSSTISLSIKPRIPKRGQPVSQKNVFTLHPENIRLQIYVDEKIYPPGPACPHHSLHAAGDTYRFALSPSRSELGSAEGSNLCLGEDRDASER